MEQYFSSNSVMSKCNIPFQLPKPALKSHKKPGLYIYIYISCYKNNKKNIGDKTELKNKTHTYLYDLIDVIYVHGQKKKFITQTKKNDYKSLKNFRTASNIQCNQCFQVGY